MAVLVPFVAGATALLDDELLRIISFVPPKLGDTMMGIIDAVALKESTFSVSIYNFAFAQESGVPLSSCFDNAVLLTHLVALSTADPRLSAPLGLVRSFPYHRSPYTQTPTAGCEVAQSDVLVTNVCDIL